MSDRRAERPRREESCSETRVASVVVVESLMSRRRCSTPISSASSASMADGAWRNVLRVSVPSCRQDRCYEYKERIYMYVRWAPNDARTHIFDLFHSEVGIRRNADRLWSHVDYDHHGSCNVPLEQFVDLQIRCSQFRSRVVPTDHAFPCCTATATKGSSGKFY